MWSALSDDRTGLSFTTASGPRQCSHSTVGVPRDSWPYFTVSDSRLLQPGEPGPRIYTPPGTGWPTYTPSHWVPLRRLLWLAKYLDPPPHRGNCNSWIVLLMTSLHLRHRKHYSSVVYGPLLSKCRLLWRHNSCFEHSVFVRFIWFSY
jgi:hypothetical protein